MSGVVKLLGVVTRDKKPQLLLSDTSSAHTVYVLIVIVCKYLKKHEVCAKVLERNIRNLLLNFGEKAIFGSNSAGVQRSQTSKGI